MRLFHPFVFTLLLSSRLVTEFKLPDYQQQTNNFCLKVYFTCM